MTKWQQRVLAATLLVSLSAFTPAPANAGRDSPATLPAPQVVPASKRVFMVSDSVGLGAKTAMMSAFPSDWQVTVTGKPALFVEQLVSQYVQYQPLSMFGDSAIVAAGYNYPYWDPPRFDRSIDTMVNALKAKGVKRIFWVTVREVKPAFFSGWNSLSSNYKILYGKYPQLNGQLRAALGRHPELSLIDWADVSDRTGLTYDAIHLNTTGAGIYAQLAATTVGKAATRKPAGTITEITVAGSSGVPADAAAVSLNLTSFAPRTGGFLTAYPCGGPRPIVSNVNFRPSQTVASAAIVPIGVDGKVCVYQSTEAHVIVDVNGAFGADSGFIALTPTRAIDTRGAAAPPPNTALTVHLGAISGAPTGAFTAVVNLTVLGGGLGADVRLYTCGTAAPYFPSRAISAGLIQNLTMVVATDESGDVCVTTSNAVHVLVDLFAAFPPEAEFSPIPAQRLVDTRYVGGVLVGGTQRSQQISGLLGVPASPVPTGTVLTLTMVAPVGIGFGTMFPCTPSVPTASMLNVVPNHTQTNSVVTSLSATGAVCIYSSISTHYLLDVSGWSGSAFTPLTPARLLDTRFA